MWFLSLVTAPHSEHRAEEENSRAECGVGLGFVAAVVIVVVTTALRRCGAIIVVVSSSSSPSITTVD